MLSFFYFFKKKTAYELRISDWSSDVCSSDLAPAAPDIDDDEEEQPHDVDEVPVPGGGFETEMLLRGEMTLIGAHEADDQEDRADHNVKAVEARRHIEGRAVDALPDADGRMGIFIGLDCRRDGREDGIQDKAI